MRIFLIALIALIVGAVIGYVYKQGEVNSLTQQVAALKTDVADATEKATSAAATQIDELKTELEAKGKLADEQQAKISELEAALKDATTASSAQPTPPEPTASPAEPTTTPPAPQ